MYQTTWRLKEKLCCDFEAQSWPFPRALVLGSYPTGLRYECSARAEKKWRVRGYRHSINQLQTSPTPPLPSRNVQHACCTLYSIPSLHTVWCGNQCSALCFACCCATLHHLHTSNANANRALVPQYRNVSACGCELSGGEEALPDLVQYNIVLSCTCPASIPWEVESYVMYNHVHGWSSNVALSH